MSAETFHALKSYIVSECISDVADVLVSVKIILAQELFALRFLITALLKVEKKN